ncbi:M23 family metallopeptidase [Paludibaculum fermentans]|uniref:M23 family metallopeptidase n=1 Tax=Paludibaculum fermentans TaxID=1473598 RepID=A0A7S7NS80_PALFE|nr:M23 family metallopeptidase [Paludibaculum fermentans]QOY88827.1 M23 family metallopeptidase [Paludibaculum fermentans]
MRALLCLILLLTLFLAPLPAAAQSPLAVKQGEVLRFATHAAFARVHDRKFPIYDGTALIPAAVIDKPGDYPLELLSADGKTLETRTLTILDAHYLTQNVALSKEVVELKPSPGETETVNALKHLESPAKLWAEPFLAPVPGCMNSPFGVQRYQNGKPTGNYHAGVDQRGPAGKPIVATAAGTVRMVRSYNIHGNVVGVDHGQGIVSIYLHMSKTAAHEGDAVKPGDVLGYVGATGRANGPHLHWSLYVHAVAVNPSKWAPLTACAATAPARKAPPKKAPAKKTRRAQ